MPSGFLVQVTPPVRLYGFPVLPLSLRLTAKDNAALALPPKTFRQLQYCGRPGESKFGSRSLVSACVA
jgi:hypothetical protein